MYYNRLRYNTVFYNSQPDVEIESESVESVLGKGVYNELYYANMRLNSLFHVSKYELIIKKDYANNTKTI